jgi:c-di-GMP-binding flagellar brake protein YcgR
MAKKKVKKKVKKSASDKRRHQRFPVGISMDIHAAGGAIARVSGTITDLSVGGMTFKTNKDLEEGSMLYLKVNIPLEIRGEVRHMRGGSAGARRYGVRFHKIGFEGTVPQEKEKFIKAKFQK